MPLPGSSIQLHGGLTTASSKTPTQLLAYRPSQWDGREQEEQKLENLR